MSYQFSSETLRALYKNESIDSYTPNKMIVYMMSKLGNTKEKLDQISKKFGLPSENITRPSSIRNLAEKSLSNSCLTNKENHSLSELNKEKALEDQKIDISCQKETLYPSKYLNSASYSYTNSYNLKTSRSYTNTSFQRTQRIPTERIEKSRSNSNFNTKKFNLTERTSFERTKKSVDYETFKRISQARTRYLLRSVSQGIKKSVLDIIRLNFVSELDNENEKIENLIISKVKKEFIKDVRDIAVIMKVYFSLRRAFKATNRKTKNDSRFFIRKWRLNAFEKTKKLNSTREIFQIFEFKLYEMKLRIISQISKIQFFSNTEYNANINLLKVILSKILSRGRIQPFYRIRSLAKENREKKKTENKRKISIDLNYSDFKSSHLRSKIQKAAISSLFNLISKRIFLHRHYSCLALKSHN